MIHLQTEVSSPRYILLVGSTLGFLGGRGFSWRKRTWREVWHKLASWEGRGGEGRGGEGRGGEGEKKDERSRWSVDYSKCV